MLDLDADDGASVEMPFGAKILDIQFQNELLYAWAEVDPKAAPENRLFRILGTGHPMPDEELKHIKTVQQDVYVWHIYERI